MVVYNGQTTNFTGNGTVNPEKLVIPRKNEVDPPVSAALLKIEQYINGLSSPAAFGNITHTYAVSGTLQVPSGATGYLPPFFMNETCTLVGVMTLNRAGTTTLTIEKNGSAIATGVAVTTSATFHSIGASVAPNDDFQPVITAVSGSDGLTVSFYFNA